MHEEEDNELSGKEDQNKDRSRLSLFKNRALNFLKGCKANKEPKKDEKVQLKQEIMTLKRKMSRTESPMLKPLKRGNNKISAVNH